MREARKTKQKLPPDRVSPPGGPQAPCGRTKERFFMSEYDYSGLYIMAARRIITGSQRALSRNSPRTEQSSYPNVGQQRSETPPTPHRQIILIPANRTAAITPRAPLQAMAATVATAITAATMATAIPATHSPRRTSPKRATAAKRFCCVWRPASVW